MATSKYLTKTDWVASELREAITSGGLDPGEPLRILDWAKKLGVSATPVREALKLLEAEGYLETSRHRGARVVTVSTQEYREYYRMLAVLDPLAAEFAAERVALSERPDLCSNLRRLNQKLERIVHSGKLSSAKTLMRQFHREVYAIANSSVLYSAVAPLWAVFPTAFELHLLGDADQVVSQEIVIHGEILAAIQSGDANAAAKAMRGDITRALERITSALVEGDIVSTRDGNKG